MDIYVVQVISFPTFRVYLTSSLVVLCKQWVEKPDGLEFKKHKKPEPPISLSYCSSRTTKPENDFHLRNQCDRRGNACEFKVNTKRAWRLNSSLYYRWRFLGVNGHLSCVQRWLGSNRNFTAYFPLLLSHPLDYAWRYGMDKWCPKHIWRRESSTSFLTMEEQR